MPNGHAKLVPPQLVNRIQESAAITDFLVQPQQHPRIRILSSQPHSGLSYFLRYCSDRKDGSLVSLYADGAKHEGNSVFAQLGLDLFRKYRPIWKQFINVQESRAGRTRLREISSAIGESIPYIGRVLARGVQLASPTLPLSPYPSIAAELVCEFLATVSQERPVCLFLDNAQELDDWSSELLSTTVGRSYKSLRYVAGYVLRAAGADLNGFALKSKDIGYDVGVTSFPRPDEEFIRLYASSFRIDWSPSQCRAIAAATGGDIYQIRAAVNALHADGELADGGLRDLSPLGRLVLAQLTVAKQDLRRSDVLAICLSDDAVFVESAEDVDRTIELLAKAGLVGLTPLPDGDRLVALRPSAEAIREALKPSAVETLHLEDQLYEYFSRVWNASRRHSAAEVAPLLYRLARSVDTENLDVRLRDIIRLSLQMGSQSIAEEFVDRAVHASQATLLSLPDYLAKLAFLVSVKQFKRVLEMIDHGPTPQWRSYRTVQIFRGIALNRRRLHDESEKVLAELCETSTSLEELAVMVSYRIVGRIHANDISGAQVLYVRYQGRLSAADNYGYFLRNGAEVYEARQGVEILTQALLYHKKHDDTFGIATTLCNRGAKLAQIGQAQAGLTEVERAYDLLEVFGVHHLGIAIGDLAHCFLYLGMYEQAERTCRKAFRYMGRELPRAYTLLNLAAAQLLQDHKDQAIATIEQVAAEIKDSTVDRVKQKVYLNGALIMLLAEASDSVVESFCTNALQHPDRRDPLMTATKIAELRKRAIEGRQTLVDSFFDFYSPCSLFYWYQNPLEGLPLDFLPFQTIPKDAND